MNVTAALITVVSAHEQEKGYINCGIFIQWNIRNKMGRTTDTCYNMNDSYTHHIKQKKCQPHKEFILHDSIYIKF